MPFARRSLLALVSVALFLGLAPAAVVGGSPARVAASASSPTLRLDIARLEGFAYKPAPSDYHTCDDLQCPFYDSDFANTDFRVLWDSGTVTTQSGPVTGRGDLRVMQGAGANFLRLYDWNAPPRRNHLPFLDAAKAIGLKVTIPFSLYYLHGATDPNVRPAIERIIQEIYTDPATGTVGTVPHAAANMWLIGNEVELSGGYATAQNVAQVAEILYAWEQAHGATVVLPISAAVSFGYNGGTIEAIRNMTPIVGALLASEKAGRLPAGFTKSRLVFGVNTTNPAGSLGPWLDRYKAYWASSTDGLGGYVPPMFFSEMGPNLAASCNGYTNCTPSEAQQGIFARDIWNMLAKKEGDAAYGFVRGAAEFELTAEPWKGYDPKKPLVISEEGTFGLWRYDPKFNGDPDPAKRCQGQKIVTEPYMKPAGQTWTFCLDRIVPKDGWPYVVQAIDSLRDSVPPPPVRTLR